VLVCGGRPAFGDRRGVGAVFLAAFLRVAIAVSRLGAHFGVRIRPGRAAPMRPSSTTTAPLTST
jgi:hypothetical protein